MKLIYKQLNKIKEIVKKSYIKDKEELEILQIITEILMVERKNKKEFQDSIDRQRINDAYAVFDFEANEREKKALKDVIVRMQKRIDRMGR